MPFQTIVRNGVPAYVAETDNETTIEVLLQRSGLDRAGITYRDATAGEIALWKERHSKLMSADPVVGNAMVTITPS